MRYTILILFSLLLSSCGVYQVSTTPKVKINKVLTITNTGDTLAVPIKEFQKYNYNNVFDNYRYNFNYGFGWYNYYYPFNNRPSSWYFRDWYYKPPIYNYSLELPQVNKPRVYVNGRRGSNNSGGSSRGNRIILKPNSNNNNNDQISRFNFRAPRSSESSNNGRRGRNGENLSPKPVIPRQPNTVQPRQIRRGSGSSIPQQTRTRVNTNNQGRNGSGRIQN